MMTLDVMYHIHDNQHWFSVNEESLDFLSVYGHSLGETYDNLFITLNECLTKAGISTHRFIPSLERDVALSTLKDVMVRKKYLGLEDEEVVLRVEAQVIN